MLLSELTPYDGSGMSYFYRADAASAARPPRDVERELGDGWELPPLAA